MNKLQANSGRFMLHGNHFKQPQKLKAKIVQLTLSDVVFEIGKDRELLGRIGIRINKTLPEVMSILKKLRQF